MNDITPWLFVKWVLALFIGFNLIVVTIAFVSQLRATVRERREREKAMLEAKETARRTTEKFLSDMHEKFLRPTPPLVPPPPEEKSDA
jgi:hypothetical protein